MEMKIIDILKNNFYNINNWLNFAEAKNAANVAFVVACLTAIISFDFINVFTYFIMIMLILSGIISLLSFIPNLKTNPIRYLKKHSKPRSENLLFFEVIKEMSGEIYLKSIYHNYLKRDIENFGKYELDLANECIINSQIVSVKHLAFKYSVTIDVVALIVSVILLIVA